MSRLLFISLEFSAGTFSGNGVYARSQVRSLCKQGSKVLVFSGKPVGYTAPDQAEGAQQLIQVEVPVWDRLDRASGWSALATQAASDSIVQHVAAFQAEAVLGVDWSSLPAYKALAAALHAKGFPVPPYIYMNYRVYLRTCAPADQEFMQRMESAAAATATLTVALSRNDADFIKTHLLPSDKPAASVLVLLPALRSDMAAIPLPTDQHLQPDRPPSASTQGEQQSTGSNTAAEPTGVQTSMDIDNNSGQSTAAVAASLQQTSGSSTASDIAARAVDESPIRPVIKQTSSGSCVSPIIGRRTTAFSSSSASSLESEDAVLANDPTEALQVLRPGPQRCQPRPYLTCCVRLSPEKEPHRFVELVQELARQDSLQQLGIQPLMCASSNTPYAVDLVAKLRSDAPDSIIETRFLGPQQLAEIYSKTRLNIHPCLYDAYGMTVVEAASQGAPSLVNGNGAVGATDLLRGPSEVFEVDLSMPTAQLAQQVASLWADAAKLVGVSKAAASKARSWTEAANAEMLLSLVNRCLHGRK